jgi:hypothetical protein
VATGFANKHKLDDLKHGKEIEQYYNRLNDIINV